MKDWSLPRCLAAVALATGALLLIPLAAMQFTREVDWGLGDFLLAAALLFSAGAAGAIAFKFLKRPAYKKAVIGAIALAVALVWAELAVGLFD